jgi:hypothetical protein
VGHFKQQHALRRYWRRRTTSEISGTTSEKNDSGGGDGDGCGGGVDDGGDNSDDSPVDSSVLYMLAHRLLADVVVGIVVAALLVCYGDVIANTVCASLFSALHASIRALIGADAAASMTTSVARTMLLTDDFAVANGGGNGAFDSPAPALVTVNAFVGECVRWISDTPAGLKLNMQVSDRLASIVMLMLTASTDTYISFISLYCDVAIVASTLAVGLFGFAFARAFLVDCIALATAHLSLLRHTFNRLYTSVASVLQSLFALFRGKKINVLRQRVDTEAYDIEHRVLGSLFVLVAVFMFPTIAVYALALSAISVVIVVVSRCTLLVYGVVAFAVVPLLCSIVSAPLHWCGRGGSGGVFDNAAIVRFQPVALFDRDAPDSSKNSIIMTSTPSHSTLRLCRQRAPSQRWAELAAFFTVVLSTSAS